jgi:hypothetical protein
LELANKSFRQRAFTQVLLHKELEVNQFLLNLFTSLLLESKGYRSQNLRTWPRVAMGLVIFASILNSLENKN